MLCSSWARRLLETQRIGPDKSGIRQMPDFCLSDDNRAQQKNDLPFAFVHLHHVIPSIRWLDVKERSGESIDGAALRRLWTSGVAPRPSVEIRRDDRDF